MWTILRNFVRRHFSLKTRQKIFNVRRFWLSVILRMFDRHSGKNDGSAAFNISCTGIGDFVIWLASAGEFRKIFPNGRLSLFCRESVAQLAEATGFFDEVIPLDYDVTCGIRPLSRFVLRRRLRRYSFETLVQCVYFKSVDSDYISSCIDAKKKISIDTEYTNMTARAKKNTDRIYDLLVPTGGRGHLIQKNAEFLRGLGLPYRSRPQVLPRFTSALVPDRPYFVVFPGGSDEDRRWSAANFAAAARYAAGRSGLSCCICGSDSEAFLAEKISETAGSETDIIDLTGKTTLGDLTEVIRNAAFLVSNDTSAVHIAAGTATPSVCIMGPWEYAHFLPYDVDDDCGAPLPLVCCEDMPCARCMFDFTPECLEARKNMKQRLCISRVSVQSVLEKIDRVLPVRNAPR